jgi:phosphoribosylformylglycinamidine synthase
VTLAECAIASGVGVKINPGDGLDPHVWLFSESAARVIVTAPSEDVILEAASKAGISATVLGRTGGAHLWVEGLLDLEVSEMAATFEGALPSLLS